jgi:hypothetical protein
LDFFVWEFDDGDGGPEGRLDVRQRANRLVDAYRKLSPFNVDIRGIPGWLLGPEHEATMPRDSLALHSLVES